MAGRSLHCQSLTDRDKQYRRIVVAFSVLHNKMAKVTFFLVFSFLVAFSACDVSISPEIITTEGPITSTEQSTTPATKPTTSKTTPASTTSPTITPTTITTPASTTSPTTKPTTITTPATTTSPATKPTTITTPASTTTPTTKPTITTPATTTSKPTIKPTDKPSPKPETGIWQVNITSTNNSCILLQMAAYFDISYEGSVRSKELEGSVIVPTNANVTGTCGNNTQNMTLVWNEDENSTDSITFIFNKNGSTFDLEYMEANITFNKYSFDNANKTFVRLVHAKKDFVTSVGQSYKCAKLQMLNLTDISTNKSAGTFNIQHVQIQAFGNITGKAFSEANDCEPYETPDIVPIAVGCALAGLILIVLIAYLIGRRRNQVRGYLSM